MGAWRTQKAHVPRASPATRRRGGVNVVKGIASPKDGTSPKSPDTWRSHHVPEAQDQLTGMNTASPVSGAATMGE